jgi:GNAT superfamily N-acetyltransferase
MRYLIRAATEADIPRLLELYDELLQPPGSIPPGYTAERAVEGIRHAIDSPSATILVAEAEGEVVGLASLYRTFPSVRHGLRCWLQDLVTTASKRSQGAGKALLDAATEWARGQHCTHLMLDSGNGRKDAHRFYLREGMNQHSITFERPLD